MTTFRDQASYGLCKYAVKADMCLKSKFLSLAWSKTCAYSIIVSRLRNPVEVAGLVLLHLDIVLLHVCNALLALLGPNRASTTSHFADTPGKPTKSEHLHLTKLQHGAAGAARAAAVWAAQLRHP